MHQGLEKELKELEGKAEVAQKEMEKVQQERTRNFFFFVKNKVFFIVLLAFCTIFISKQATVSVRFFRLFSHIASALTAHLCDIC